MEFSNEGALDYLQLSCQQSVGPQRASNCYEVIAKHESLMGPAQDWLYTIVTVEPYPVRNLRVPLLTRTRARQR